jgi:hypothetical protein
MYLAALHFDVSVNRFEHNSYACPDNRVSATGAEQGLHFLSGKVARLEACHQPTILSARRNDGHRAVVFDL